MTARTLHAAGFVLADPCPMCGCRPQGFALPTLRVLARTVRVVRPGLAFVRPCPECGWDRRSDRERWVATPETLHRIDTIQRASA